MWCWAAVSEQLIRWKNGGPGPNQCEMVSMSMGLPAVACCSPPNPTVLNQCNTKGGSLQDIQAGMAAFGHTYSAITPPGSPQQLSDELVQGHPVIVEIRSTPVSNHVMVITGIFNTPNGPMVQINDPADPASAPVRGTY